MADPAVKAANELNAIFGRLEVPCEVCVSSNEGKHVKATAALEADVALVEELPIVSWPSASLLTLRLPFCFHCLRLSSHEGAAPAAASPESSASSTTVTLPEPWTRCAQCQSCFCSLTCQQASARTHRLLCSCLPQLRTASSASPTAATSGIAVESLARCVAWVIQRLSAAIEQQQLTHDVLQADYVSQLTSGGDEVHSTQTSWSASSLNYQLFTQVVAPFSRLISPPDSVQFDGVSLPQWIETVRSLLVEKSVKVLLFASGAPLPKLPLHPLAFEKDGDRAGTLPTTTPAASLYWAEALAQILFSTDTLRTLVGQLALNAHAINDYLLPAPETAPSNGGAAFAWILKGAGLYSLLASFNHSCAPNCAVSNVEETHEIVLKTTRPVAAGDELTITYIPLTASSARAERQHLLKNYFFTCHCPRCSAEEKAV